MILTWPSNPIVGVGRAVLVWSGDVPSVLLAALSELVISSNHVINPLSDNDSTPLDDTNVFVSDEGTPSEVEIGDDDGGRGKEEELIVGAAQAAS
jgi:hypothetical protein